MLPFMAGVSWPRLVQMRSTHSSTISREDSLNRSLDPSVLIRIPDGVRKIRPFSS